MAKADFCGLYFPLRLMSIATVLEHFYGISAGKRVNEYLRGLITSEAQLY